MYALSKIYIVKHIIPTLKVKILFYSAGSQAVSLKGLYDSALLFPRPLNLKEMVSCLQADYLIIEGLQKCSCS